MSLGEFMRKTFMDYFIIVTGVTLVMGIMGLIYQPKQQFGYEAYFSPLIFGLMGVVPTFATYSKKELSLKQMKVRKVLQFILLEAMILSFCLGMGIITREMVGSMAFSVMLVFIGVHGTSWVIGNRKARELTTELKAFQKANHD